MNSAICKRFATKDTMDTKGQAFSMQVPFFVSFGSFVVERDLNAD